jgi:ABC-type sugar transport system permease subunit
MGTSRGLGLHAVAYGFLAPALLCLLVFRLWPILQAARVSLTDLSILSGVEDFVGFANYQTRDRQPDLS